MGASSLDSAKLVVFESVSQTKGIDVHAASCTLAVISEAGRRLRSMVVETNGEALVGAIRSVPGHRRVVLEEGTQAGWLSELLEPHAAEEMLARVDGRRGQKSDELDAYELADRLRLGAVKRRVGNRIRRLGGVSVWSGRGHAVLTGRSPRWRLR
jgi:hypothetical protein